MSDNVLGPKPGVPEDQIINWLPPDDLDWFPADESVAEPERREAESYRRGQRDMLARCIDILMSAQDVAQSGEGVIVTVLLGAGRGSVYVNRDLVERQLRALLPVSESSGHRDTDGAQ